MGNSSWFFGSGHAASIAGPNTFLTLGSWYRVELGHVWQDTAGTVPATANNDPVARLDDQSGAGLHMIQATGNKQPLLKLNVNKGRPGLLFDGVNDELRATGTPTIGTGYVIAKSASSDPFPDYWGCFTDGSGSDSDIMFTGSNGLTSWYEPTGRFSGAIYVDNVLETTTFSLSPLTSIHLSVGLDSTPTAAVTRLQLGHDRLDAARFWGGYIFEAGTTAAAISSGNRSSLHTYSTAYWGTP